MEIIVTMLALIGFFSFWIWIIDRSDRRKGDRF